MLWNMMKKQMRSKPTRTIGELRQKLQDILNKFRLKIMDVCRICVLLLLFTFFLLSCGRFEFQ